MALSRAARIIPDSGRGPSVHGARLRVASAAKIGRQRPEFANEAGILRAVNHARAVRPHRGPSMIILCALGMLAAAAATAAQDPAPPAGAPPTAQPAPPPPNSQQPAEPAPAPAVKPPAVIGEKPTTEGSRSIEPPKNEPTPEQRAAEEAK